ncbi:MAG: AAC(3) family N-acetyltransferase [Peptococcaceae bacterium]|nr:AAC(3) family N-acetyltransferase [Peptococcaceae bacterium]
MHVKQKIKKLIKRVELKIDAKAKLQISAQDIVGCLQEQGFGSGDRVMVHSALSRIGYVEGGAASVVAALQQVIGEQGLLVMPSFPAPERTIDYVLQNPVFSVGDTPSKMGTITEVFRTSPNVFRSLHPTHPLIAWGKDAVKFVDGHLRDGAPFATGTPYEKIKQLGFKVLLIGVDFENMTACRIIDDIEPNFPVSPYMPQLYKLQVVDAEGVVHEISVKVHNPEISAKRKNMILYPYMKQEGKVQEFKMGDASCMWVYVDDLYDLELRLMQQNITTYEL